MHLEVVQALRCPRDHEASWLVARTDRMEARHILAGVLGCPLCGAEYPVVAGTVRFGEPVPSRTPGDDAAVRAAALLGLTTPNGLVALAGAWAGAAVDVAAIADGVHVLAADLPGPTPPFSLGVSAIACGAVLPLGSGVARGVALDAGHATPAAITAASEALVAGGRLLAPAHVPVPEALNVMARDERWWVAERASPSPVVPLRSSRGGPR